MFERLKKVVVPVACLCSMSMFASSANAAESQSLPPLVTGIPVTIAPAAHYVAVPHDITWPTQNPRNGYLVVFLGGSSSLPGFYSEISDYVADLGFPVISLSYPNLVPIADVCLNADNCYTQFRGETVFGQGIPYNGVSYNHGLISVAEVNSVIGRLVRAIDYLANAPSEYPAGADLTAGTPIPGGFAESSRRTYWSQFLSTAPNNNDGKHPYKTRFHSFVAPNWSKIIVAGHSQGGGHAAFLGMYGPETVHRVVMLSAPEDRSACPTLGLGCVQPLLGMTSQTASWMLFPSNTQMDRFWGLRHDDDTTLGEHVADNWAVMGGPFAGGVGGDGSPAASVGNGSGATLTNLGVRHRLRMTSPDLGKNALGFLYSHNCTAANNPLDALNVDYVSNQTCGTIMTGRHEAWKYLFTGAGAD